MSSSVAILLGIIGLIGGVATAFVTVWAKSHFERIDRERQEDRRHCKEELDEIRKDYKKLTEYYIQSKRGL